MKINKLYFLISIDSFRVLRFFSKADAVLFVPSLSIPWSKFSNPVIVSSHEILWYKLVVSRHREPMASFFFVLHSYFILESLIFVACIYIHRQNMLFLNASEYLRRYRRQKHFYSRKYYLILAVYDIIVGPLEKKYATYILFAFFFIFWGILVLNLYTNKYIEYIYNILYSTQ